MQDCHTGDKKYIYTQGYKMEGFMEVKNLT